MASQTSPHIQDAEKQTFKSSSHHHTTSASHDFTPMWEKSRWGLIAYLVQRVKKNNSQGQLGDGNYFPKVESWSGPSPGQFWQLGIAGRLVRVTNMSGPTSGCNFPCAKQPSHRGKGHQPLQLPRGSLSAGSSRLLSWSFGAPGRMRVISLNDIPPFPGVTAWSGAHHSALHQQMSTLSRIIPSPQGVFSHHPEGVSRGEHITDQI